MDWLSRMNVLFTTTITKRTTSLDCLMTTTLFSTANSHWPFLLPIKMTRSSWLLFVELKARRLHYFLIFFISIRMPPIIRNTWSTWLMKKLMSSAYSLHNHNSMSSNIHQKRFTGLHSYALQVLKRKSLMIRPRNYRLSRCVSSGSRKMRKESSPSRAYTRLTVANSMKSTTAVKENYPRLMFKTERVGNVYKPSNF